MSKHRCNILQHTAACWKEQRQISEYCFAFTSDKLNPRTRSLPLHAIGMNTTDEQSGLALKYVSNGLVQILGS